MPETTVPRSDPKSTAPDGDVRGRLSNLRPDRHYILANPNDEHCGVVAMEELGYVVETQRKDGPVMKGARGTKDGTALMDRGQFLMSCPMDEHVARLRAGWAIADQRDEAISKQPGGIDAVRGPSGRLAENRTVNEA